MRSSLRAFAALVFGLCLALPAQPAGEQGSIVQPPPESFFALVRAQDRDAARQFYKKHLDVNGMPVVAAAVVEDGALQRTRWMVMHMLAGRPDIMKSMISNGMYLIIIGKDQVYTDMPEYRNAPNPAYLNERVRGTGGKPTSFGEENVLSLPLDRYDDESIGVHEFCHTIDGALRNLEPSWTGRRNQAFARATARGLWKHAYAGGNPGEFWAEIAQSYFDCNRVNNWNHGPVGTREQLKAYDPESYELVRDVFRLTPDQDWRYRPLQKLPNIIPPPAKFRFDPWYTKFTWAREFPVVGRSASDAALLQANDMIRKMFAYRHDILKALIAGGLKLVVLGRNERIADLPEFKQSSADEKLDAMARTLDYSPGLKLLVVDEANVLGKPGDSNIGDNQVIRVFANAIHAVTGRRPVDPNWETRGQAVQQYELRVTRLDERFGQRLKRVFEISTEAGKWKGTSAINDEVHFWIAGVLAYFDAKGQDGAPSDARHPILTREALREYDAELFGLVAETMAYEGHVDWRLAK